MQVTEHNLASVNKILQAVGESLLRLYSISGAEYVETKERIGTAQLAVDIFEEYYSDLQQLESKG